MAVPRAPLTDKVPNPDFVDSDFVSPPLPEGRVFTEEENFIIEHALNFGAEIVDDDATIYQLTDAQLVDLVMVYKRGVKDAT